MLTDFVQFILKAFPRNVEMYQSSPLDSVAVAISRGIPVNRVSKKTLWKFNRLSVVYHKRG